MFVPAYQARWRGSRIKCQPLSKLQLSSCCEKRKNVKNKTRSHRDRRSQTQTSLPIIGTGRIRRHMRPSQSHIAVSINGSVLPLNTALAG